ncbi:UNKNOWN [Stylonychia lemnae]|uniref:HMG box domain-containing protein n=1 Tax=Stylonychia lemnae TaxID=5949 RepID=A0A077ZZN8_STYLE|nr:UNKNOWN [Stylonychia lemnae]|eukprot:CDW75396.1 UNKNOWN [Stylonychia lemnae]
MQPPPGQYGPPMQPQIHQHEPLPPFPNYPPPTPSHNQQIAPPIQIKQQIYGAPSIGPQNNLMTPNPHQQIGLNQEEYNHNSPHFNPQPAHQNPLNFNINPNQLAEVEKQIKSPISNNNNINNGQQQNPPHQNNNSSSKKKRDKLKPDNEKKPMTPYFLFHLQMSRELKTKHKDLKQAEMGKVISELWKNLRDFEKEAWRQSAVKRAEELGQSVNYEYLKTVDCSYKKKPKSGMNNIVGNRQEINENPELQQSNSAISEDNN